MLPSNLRFSRLVATAAALILFCSTFASAQEGEACASYEKPSDLLPSIFPETAPAPLVGGSTGCTIGTSTDCYCHFVIDGTMDSTVDPDRAASPWQWQCGPEKVPFGPIEGKTCPADYPDGEVCDPAVNPTGYPGDPSCGYNDCDAEATFSATCGCIDLFAMGMGDSSRWVCFKSGCDCPASAEEGADNETVGENTSTSGTSSTFGGYGRAILSIALVISTATALVI